MKKESTSKRLKQIMTEQNLKQADLLNKCKPICEKYNKKYDLNLKVSKSDLSQWLSGIYEPSSRKLSVLAEALNTNEVWLMGYDVSKDVNFKGVVHDDEKNAFLFYFGKDNKQDFLNQYKELLEKDNNLKKQQKEKIYNTILNEYNIDIDNNIERSEK